MSLNFRIFNILIKINMEIEDDEVFKNSLVGIKNCFKTTGSFELVKIFDKIFD